MTTSYLPFLVFFLTSVNSFCLHPKKSKIKRTTTTSFSSSHIIKPFDGPTFDGTELICSLELEELGLVLSIAESSVAPASLGLFVRISDHVEEAIVPSMSLLVGYAKGTFQTRDVGDKTVAFYMTAMDAPVFFQRQLITLEQAVAACCTSNQQQQQVKVKGHDIFYDEQGDKIVIVPTTTMYFVPNEEDEMNVTNFGQYCNDRAFVAGIKQPEYITSCDAENCVRLVWRLEYDEDLQMLSPSWPVSVLSRDMRFCNREPIELGTTYGWKYWDATVDLDLL